MKSDDSVFSGQLTVSIELPYRVYLPDHYVDTGEGFPLLLFLHGAGERGSDLTALANTGLPKEIEQGMHLPFVTICPQCPLNEAWDEHKPVVHPASVRECAKWSPRKCKAGNE